MPLNPLFWLLAAAAIVAVATLFVRRSHTDAARPVKEGRLAGYSSISGENVSVDESVVAFDGGRWQPQRLETFHSAERSRLILTLRLEAEGTADLQAFLERLGQEVQARTSANVVYLEVERTEGAVAKMLYAPDGLGWTGHERLQMVWTSPGEQLEWR